MVPRLLFFAPRASASRRARKRGGRRSLDDLAAVTGEAEDVERDAPWIRRIRLAGGAPRIAEVGRCLWEGRRGGVDGVCFFGGRPFFPDDFKGSTKGEGALFMVFL